MLTLTLGDCLTGLVKRQGLTMAAFARTIGATPSTLSRVRTGERLPSNEQLEAWATALHCSAEERGQLRELLLLAQTPPDVRQRLAQIAAQAEADRDRVHRLEHDYGAYRTEQRYHDGHWLTFSASFQDDGHLQRSLLTIAGDRAVLQVRELGHLHYSYHGSFETLGDKAFLRLTEDRGGVEHVQIVLDSLFDYREPSFLYGLVCGISGKDAHHPVSRPAAARLLVLYAGREADLPADGEKMTRLQDVLGTFDPGTMRQAWPHFLGNGDWHSQCLRLGDEPLDQAILRLTDNRLHQGHVLRASL